MVKFIVRISSWMAVLIRVRRLIEGYAFLIWVWNSVALISPTNLIHVIRLLYKRNTYCPNSMTESNFIQKRRYKDFVKSSSHVLNTSIVLLEGYPINSSLKAVLAVNFDDCGPSRTGDVWICHSDHFNLVQNIW